MSFINKVVLVTGASSGIGAAIAKKFSAEGAKVAIVGRNETKLNEIKEKCKEIGNEPLVITADVSLEIDAERIINETIKYFGKLDVLINNAGILRKISIHDERALEVFDQVINTNLRSVVYLIHFAGKYLIETKGNIINISSIAALRVMGIERFCYNTSKAALDHFSRSVALDFASKGVRVNIINPGPVRTDIYENMGGSAEDQEAAWEMVTNWSALNRISDPFEIADLALFLASDKAVGITGSSFVADNGCILKQQL